MIIAYFISKNSSKEKQAILARIWIALTLTKRTKMSLWIKKVFEIIVLISISVRDKVHEIVFEYICQALEKQQRCSNGHYQVSNNIKIGRKRTSEE